MGSNRPDTDVVTLKAMRFHARIGMLPHEAEIDRLPRISSIIDAFTISWQK